MSESEANLAGLPEERQPLQDRSRASLTRMIDAARQLLVAHGSAEFSLSDVSRAGRVSIGSIYHRFQSKDELLQAVHKELMQELTREQVALVARAQLRSTTLPELLSHLVEGMAEFLRAKSGVLRPMMLCANKDPVIAAGGAAGHYHMCGLYTQALLTYASDMKRPNPEQAAVTCFKLTYAAIGHELGFGAAAPPRDVQNWERLKIDLAEMCAAFLITAPITPVPLNGHAKPKSRRAAATRARR